MLPKRAGEAVAIGERLSYQLLRGFRGWEKIHIVACVAVCPRVGNKTVSMRKHTGKTVSEQEAEQANFKDCGELGNGVKLVVAALERIRLS